MIRLPMSIILVSVLWLSSCAKKDVGTAADRPHATVLMRDGTKFSGAVLESSPTEIKLTGDDGVTHTIPMGQVKTVDYGEAPPQAAEAPSQPGAPAQAPASAPARTPGQARAPSAVTTRTYELAPGAEVSVRVDETIDSAQAAEGQTFAAQVTKDVTDASGDVVIPRGSRASIVIRSASKGGKVKGSSDLVLDLQSVSIEGRRYQLSTTDLKQTGREGMGANKRTAEFTGGGAALGAVIGAIAGGGKGAAIGAGSGAGAGALTQILTKGAAIKVPAESVLTFKLDRPLRVVAAER